MKPHIHLATNLAVSVPLYYAGFFQNVQYAIIFILSSVLIDIDHLFFFAFKHKTINPKKWWDIGIAYYQKNQANFYIFHAPEVNILLAILSFYHHIFLIILTSNVIHLTLDVINHYQKQKSFEVLKTWSIINALINR